MAEPVHDRHGIHILDVHECLDRLRTVEVGRLAVMIGDHPEIFPVNFAVDHGSVVFRTAEGTKLAAVVFGANVAFEVDGYNGATADAWSVVVKGRAMEVRDIHERFEATELPLLPWHGSPKPRFVRITPIEVSGRQFPVVGHPAAAERGQPLRRAAPE